MYCTYGSQNRHITTTYSIGENKIQFVCVYCFNYCQAEFNRRSGGHTGRAPATAYRRDTKWRDFVRDRIKRWVNTNLAWRDAFSGDNKGKQEEEEDRLLMVRYEDLVEDPLFQLRRVLSFLGMPPPSPEVWACVSARREGAHRRPPPPPPQMQMQQPGFDVFEQMRREVADRMGQVYGELGLPVPPVPHPIP